jgi:NFU1 iron-sulfur cluster scaffold homolog, mitochondrial
VLAGARTGRAIAQPEVRLLKILKPLSTLFSGKSSEPARSEGPSSPLGGVAACEEVSLQHLWSDDPATLKFQLGTALLPFGEQRSYESREAAGESPLAQALFEAGGIAAVTLSGNTLTVRMDEAADWDGLHQRLPAMIRKFFSAGGKALAQAGNGGAKRYAFGFREVQGRPREEQMRIVQELFDKEVNPAVAAHGGYFNLLDVQDNTVYVELGGGCQGCGMANVTLRQGVEARLREVLPEMAALVDTTDHASGQNPYYQASKK